MASRHPLGLYLDACGRVRRVGAGTAETSVYPAVSDALNAVGGDLWPKVFARVRDQRPRCQRAGLKEVLAGLWRDPCGLG